MAKMTRRKNREGKIPIEKLAKLRECIEKGINYLDLRKPARFDYARQSWIVETEGGEVFRFDEDRAAAEDFYNEGPK